VQTLSHDFDGNEDSILSVISFLNDVGWQTEGKDGNYMITDKGTERV